MSEENGERVGLSLLEGDENVGSFLKNMRGAINRCFSLIEAMGVLPDKSVNVSPEYDGKRWSFKLPTDCHTPVRVARYHDGGAEGNVEHWRIAAEIVIPEYDEGSVYVLIYKPRISRLSFACSDFEELDLPDHIAEHVPYFIKGDLFRDDEPSEADDARERFETAMSLLMRQYEGEQRSVDTVWGGLI